MADDIRLSDIEPRFVCAARGRCWHLTQLLFTPLVPSMNFRTVRHRNLILPIAIRPMGRSSVRCIPTHLPRQGAESHPFTDELDPEQYTEQPDCCRGEVGQKIERQQYSNNAAG